MMNGEKGYASLAGGAADDANKLGAKPMIEFVPSAGEDFVQTSYVRDLTDRALAYLEIGYAVHLSGPAGTGKTTLALHIASQRARSCTLIHGDDEYRGSDLIGKDSGYRRTSVRDNYVSSIVKTEETMSTVWSSNRLTIACQKGHTLIYDEFTRSPATANNPFLSILEEGILNIPSSGDEKGYLKVHPDFRAIFTSNPEEYVGVHKTQDALLDRMITIELEHPDRETEIAIVKAKSSLPESDCSIIVDIIRGTRELCGTKHGPTVRAAIAIAQIAQHRGFQIEADDPVFLTTCEDVLYFNASRQSSKDVDRDFVKHIVSKQFDRASGIEKQALTGSNVPRSPQATLQGKRKEAILTESIEMNPEDNSVRHLQTAPAIAKVDEAEPSSAQPSPIVDSPQTNATEKLPVVERPQLVADSLTTTAPLAKKEQKQRDVSGVTQEKSLESSIQRLDTLATALHHLNASNIDLPLPPATDSEEATKSALYT